MSSLPSTDPILLSLNKAQCRAVTSSANTIAILAGPGSGKTHTLTSRVVWLVDRVGYRPENIIVATFTVKAAREMKERIGKALGNGREKKIILGTFHSVARRYLASYGTRIGLDKKFGIADDNDSRAIIKRIIERLKLGLDIPGARSWISKKKARGSIDDEPSQRATSKPLPKSSDLVRCFEEYQSHLERSNLLDYDDLLTRCVDLLREFPDCVSNVQAVLIDEYQDTNGIQYELMRLLAQSQRQITIVGDPDQSIYGWRSADIRNLHRMLKDYPGTDEISLEENYRSSPRILDASLKVIQQDAKRYQKALLPVHKKGTPPVLRRLKKSADEADWIVSELRRCKVLMDSMMTYNDVAILLRQASLSRHIEAALGRAGISYRMVGGFKFYDRAEIKVLLDYLRVVHQPENNDALIRVINIPKRGIGEATIKSLLEEAETSQLKSVWNVLTKHCKGERTAATNLTKGKEQKISVEFLKVIRELREKIEQLPAETPFDLEELVDQLLLKLNFQKYIEATYPEDHEQRWANILEFVNLAKDFMRELKAEEEETLPEIDGLDQVKEADALGKFLANVSLASDVQTGDKGEDNKPLVTISTIHAAKGLEWPIVFVPSVYEGMIPHMRSEDNDEDRRLLYVAMTRAKALLYLSCPLFNARGDRVELSQFVPSTMLQYFSKKGPSFEKPMLEETGRILGRNAPSQDAVFSKMPLMFSPEDDQFPIDHEKPETGSGHNNHHAPQSNVSRSKRQRTNSSNVGQEPADKPEWKEEYSGSRYTTTMDQAPNFTMSSFSGFVTAGAHQEALAAAAATAAVAAKKVAVDLMRKKGTTKRPVDQRSLFGFVTAEPKSNAPDGAFPPQHTRPAGQASNPGVRPNAHRPQLPPQAHHQPTTTPAITPELAEHRLKKGPILLKPKCTSLGKVSGAKRHYTCFSSSPTREPKGDENKPPGEVPEQPPEAMDRPAKTFHATTMTGPKGYGVIRKPVGLKRDGIAPIDRLRKPFKPLTISRPGSSRF
jgi:DNA helicase II / ATP-dependent DNA helicase PcrA